MTQKDKELLLKDLCARLPYGVKGVITFDESNTTFTVEGIDNNVLHLSDAEECYLEDFKPYLRPRYSTTEEEKKDFNKVVYESMNIDNISPSAHVADWEYANHFDVWGLIPKGLALEAPEGMYN